MDQFLGGGVKNFYIYEKYGFRIPDWNPWKTLQNQYSE